MKIVVLSSGDTFTMRFTNSYVQLGYDVHLVVLEPINEDFNPSVKVYVLPFNRPWGAILNLLHMRRLLKRINPDIFHVHEASTNGLLGRLCNFHPNMLSVYGSDVFDVPKISQFMRHIIRSNLRHYDWVGSTSVMMSLQVRKIYPQIKNLSVTPFGIDTFQYRPSEKNDDSTDIIIGTVKRMESKYGIDLLINAFSRTRDIINRTDPQLSKQLKLLIIGNGSELEKYKDLASDLGLVQVSEFTGAVQNKAIPAYLNKMDIFVALSRLESESFGVAIVEASSCSVPVVCANVGGLPEVVDDGISGFLVDKENFVDASEKLIHLIYNKDLRKKMGVAGRNLVKEKYEWDDCVQKITQIHDKLVG
jgi:L-malate glycosyltransferase